MGETVAQGPGQPRLRHCRAPRPSQARVADGWVSPDGKVVGTYLHGVFENDAFRRRFLNTLSPGAHLPAAGGLSFRDFLETQLDRLAAAMRQHLDISLLKDLIRP